MRTLYVIALVSLCLSGIAQDPILIIGRNTGTKVLADGNSIRTFGFAQEFGENPGIPGPTIEVNEGDSVEIDFWNISQGAPHTIHLHGLDVDQENDGVPHLSFEVHHMDHGYYNFKAPHAGTYLYHCHVVSSIHVQAGMFGLLVVKPSDGSNYTWNDGYEIHSEARLFMSEIDTFWHADSVLLHDYDTNMSHHMVAIPTYAPQHFLVNGASEQQILEDTIEVRGEANSNIYVRLANIGYMGNKVVFPPALNARVISSDGRPLPTEEATDTVELYPGERYGVMCTPTAEFDDFVQVIYVNMNSGLEEDVQDIPVHIQGYLSVDEVSSTEITVYPNPAQNAIIINDAKGSLSEARSIAITGLDGKLVKRISLSNQPLHLRSISIADLTQGTYFLTITSEKDTFQHRFIKL